MDFGMFVSRLVVTKSVVGRVQQAVARSVKWILFDSRNRILLLCL